MSIQQTGKRKPELPNLELNRETLQDLTGSEAQAVEGGQKPFSKSGTCWVTGGKKTCQTNCHR
jgi:hypothetical protein